MDLRRSSNSFEDPRVINNYIQQQMNTRPGIRRVLNRHSAPNVEDKYTQFLANYMESLALSSRPGTGHVDKNSNRHSFIDDYAADFSKYDP
jgi:hypothetical protein